MFACMSLLRIDVFIYFETYILCFRGLIIVWVKYEWVLANRLKLDTDIFIEADEITFTNSN